MPFVSANACELKVRRKLLILVVIKKGESYVFALQGETRAITFCYRSLVSFCKTMEIT